MMTVSLAMLGGVVLLSITLYGILRIVEDIDRIMKGKRDEENK